MKNYTETTYTKKQISRLFCLSRAQADDLENKGYILKVKCYCYRYDKDFFTKKNLKTYKSSWLQVSKENYSKVHSKAMIKLWQNDKYRESQSEAICIGQNKDISKDNMRKAQQRRYSKPGAHEKMKQAMNRPEIVKQISNSNRATFAAKRASGYYKTKEWLQVVETKKLKEYNTKKKNGTFCRSSWEEQTCKLLLTEFSKDDIIRQYFDKERYPFNCDFYIKSLDLFIECHYGWHHNGRHFDSNNQKDLDELKFLQEKAQTSSNYKNKIYQWTDLDVRKRQYAIDNKLNWIAFYSLEDFKEWYYNNRK